MVVKCIKNENLNETTLVLPTKEDSIVTFDELIIVHGEYTICRDHTGYFITVGKEYTVYGVLQHRGNYAI